MYYFDHSATTPLLPEVSELINDINREYMGILHLYTHRVENLGQSLKMQEIKLRILFLQTLSKSFYQRWN